MLILLTTIVLLSPLALVSPKVETPETPPGRICRAKDPAAPKKDVEILPICENTPTPQPTKAPQPGKKVAP